MVHRSTLAALSLSLVFVLQGPAVAEEGDIGRGLSFLERGTELLLEGLLAELGPDLARLRDSLKDLGGYHPPEVLPNGDIIIRRRQPDDVAPKPDPETGEVDL